MVMQVTAVARNEFHTYSLASSELHQRVRGIRGGYPAAPPPETESPQVRFWHTRRTFAFEDTFGHPLYSYSGRVGRILSQYRITGCRPLL